MRSKLRLIHDATKARVQTRPENAQLTDEEFARKLLTSNHGPTCAAYLARTFKKALRTSGYFVARIPAGEEQPMWFVLAMRLFTERSERWDVHTFERTSGVHFKVSYKRHGLFARRRRGSHLRVV